MPNLETEKLRIRKEAAGWFSWYDENAKSVGIFISHFLPGADMDCVDFAEILEDWLGAEVCEDIRKGRAMRATKKEREPRVLSKFLYSAPRAKIFSPVPDTEKMRIIEEVARWFDRERSHNANSIGRFILHHLSSANMSCGEFAKILENKLGVDRIETIQADFYERLETYG